MITHIVWFTNIKEYIDNYKKALVIILKDSYHTSKTEQNYNFVKNVELFI